jgi:Holliday junction resolvase-like predicted endonuclease
LYERPLARAAILRRRAPGELGCRFPRMANWGPEVEWHERDVVVPAFQRWLEAQGWETETETEFVDVVAHRGNETIIAEVKGRTNRGPGEGLDNLYGQLLRRMPAEEVGDPNTRFAVVIPTGAEEAALRVARRVRDVLRIDVYAVSDDGQVERLAN